MLEILKSVFWVGSATLFNLLVWVVAGKVMAVTLGPTGVGMYGLLRQLAQNLNVASTFNGSTALVQGLASRPETERAGYARNVARIFLALNLVVAGLLVLGAPWLGPHLLGRQLSPALLRWMVLPLVGMSLSAFFLGVLNGYRHLKALVICQALGPLTALALIYPVVVWIRGGGDWAYALILGVPYGVIGLAAAVVSIRKGWFRKPGSTGMANSFRTDSRHFFGLSTALLIGGAASTGLQLFLNALVLRRLGLAESGQFWVAWSLSMTYVTLLLSSLGAYYLPSLSGAKDPTERASLVITFTRIASIFMPLLITIVIVFKGPMIRLLFSAELLPALTVFRWMLLGDSLKVLSWVWAFPMLADADGRTFAVFELVTNGLWAVIALLGFLWFPSSEFLGILFCGMYLLYGAATLIYVRRVHSIRIPWRTARGILSGLLVITWASLLFWTERGWNGWRMILSLAPAVAHLASSLSPIERRWVLTYLKRPQA